jgi:two-component system, cell cycle sensor histidine kinase and response regulator CckA
LHLHSVSQRLQPKGVERMSAAATKEFDRPPVWSILLVEDETSVREITRHVLESAGYLVLEASGPEQAFEILRRNECPVHLLLTDMVMPVMNGVELAAHVKALRPGMVTVFMSGYAGALHTNAGVPSWHIQKPFTVNMLLTRIADALAVPYTSRNGSGGRPLAF